MQLVFGKRSTLPASTTISGHDAPSLRLQLVAERGELGGPLRFRRGELRRNAEADDAGDILGPCPPPPLLAAALDQGLDRNALTKHKSADTLWSADLVRRKRHHVGAKRAEFQRQPASNLNRIAMQKTTGRVNDLSGLSDRLDRAGLVVCRHQRNEGLHPPRWCFASSFSSAARSITPSPRREFGSCSRDRTCRRQAPKDARSPTCSTARPRRPALQARAHSPRCRRS